MRRTYLEQIRLTGISRPRKSAPLIMTNTGTSHCVTLQKTLKQRQAAPFTSVSYQCWEAVWRTRTAVRATTRR